MKRLYKELDSYTGGGLFFTRHINQNIGKLFTILCIKYKISPNKVTLLSLIVNLVGIFTFWLNKGNVLSIIFLIITTQISYSLDCSDGQLARYINRTSNLGKWLDLLIDRINTFILLVGIEFVLIITEKNYLTIDSFFIFNFILGINLFYSYSVNLKAVIFPPSFDGVENYLLKEVILFLGDNGVFMLITTICLFTDNWLFYMLLYSIYILSLTLIFVFKNIIKFSE